MPKIEKLSILIELKLFNVNGPELPLSDLADALCAFLAKTSEDAIPGGEFSITLKDIKSTYIIESGVLSGIEVLDNDFPVMAIKLLREDSDGQSSNDNA